MSVRRALTAAAVAGGAALAVAVPAAMAQASTGVFIYHNFQDGRQFLVDQPSYQCTQIWAERFAGPVVNDTDSIALVYLTPDCAGPVQIIRPGEITELRQLPFAGSITFVND